MIQEWYEGIIEDEGIKWFNHKTLSEVWQQYVADTGDRISIKAFIKILKMELPSWIVIRAEFIDGKTTKVFVNTQYEQALLAMFQAYDAHENLNGKPTDQVWRAICVDVNSEYYVDYQKTHEKKPWSQKKFTQFVNKNGHLGNIVKLKSLGRQKVYEINY